MDDDMDIELDFPKMLKFQNLVSNRKVAMSEFLNSKPLNPDILSLSSDDLELIDWFRSKNLGEGWQGIVAELRFNKFVLKVSKCDQKSEDINCVRLREKIIYEVPYGDKSIITLPDMVSENVIGYFLNKLFPYTPSFVYNYGMAWHDGQTYSFVETLKTNLFTKEKLDTGESLLILIMQFMYAITVAQQVYQFTHLDSHILNILYEDSAPGWNEIIIKSCESCLNTKHNTFTYYLKNVGWNIKINDYGLSRLAVQKTNKIYTGTMDNTRNFNKFSHCIDYLTLFGCLFNDNFVRHSNVKLTRMIAEIRYVIREKVTSISRKLGFINPQHMIFHFVCPTLVPKNINISTFNQSITSIYGASYRPDKNYITTNSHKFLTPDQTFMYMASAFIENNLMVVTKVPQKNIIPVCSNPDTYVESNDKIRPGSYPVNFSNIPFKRVVPDQKDYKKVSIYRGIEYNLVGVDRPIIYKKKEFNMSDNIPSCDAKQIIHYVSINKKALENTKFISECCGMDIAEFMEKKDRYGIAINGGFFDILDSNRNIGYYRDNITQSELHIPELYKEYYGFIGFNNQRTNDNLFMGFLSDYKAETLDIDFGFVAGPVLIDKRKNWEFTEDIVNTKKMIPEIKEELEIFKCAIGKSKDKKILPPGIKYTNCQTGKLVNKKTTKPYFNCSSIKPGELSHGSNLNPRTAIAYNGNSGILYFIIIEGRQNRGDGIDFVGMVDIIKEIDKNITVAINLDGGGSTNMAWRIRETPDTIYNANPNKMAPYLTGNIISIVTK